MSCKRMIPATTAPPKKKNGTWDPGVSSKTIVRRTYETAKQAIANREVE